MLARWNNVWFGDLGRSLVTWSDLRREMDRVFNGLDGDWAGSQPSWFTRPAIGPSFEVEDAGAELHVRAELPGFSEKDLHITIDQNTLTLKGERKTQAPEGYSVHREERGSLSFARSFTLPSRVDPGKAAATLKNGVLDLMLPKAAEDQPRQVKVRAS